MSSPRLSLLLILSLIGNLLLAPLHTWLAAAQALPSQSQEQSADHCGAHADAEPADALDSQSDACCDGPQCDCGCVLTPALRVGPALAALWLATEAPQHPLDLQLLRHSNSPPLRPPSRV